MAGSDLSLCTAVELAGLIRTKQVSPVEATAHFLERIARYNGELNAFITTSAEPAMAQAHRAEEQVIAGEEIGPLHGVPIGVKDLDSTKGIRTTYGSILYIDHTPDYDDIPVERIRASGAVIVGKTNTPDFGWKGTTEGTAGGACGNPWDPSRTSGGSSGGSASAVAARLTPICNGSDAGGSIRIPASFCGVYGIKPTAGRVAQDYTRRAAWEPLLQSGALANTVRDAATLLTALSGPDSRDARSLRGERPDFVAAARSPRVSNLRVAWSPAMDGQPVDPEVRELTEKGALAFEELGASVENATPPVTTEEAIQTFVTIMMTDLRAKLEPVFEAGQGDFLPSQLLQLLRGVSSWRATRYSQALHDLTWEKRWFDLFFEEYDLLATPTMAVPAFPIEQYPGVIDGREVFPPWGFTPFCFHANLTGRPSASLPCGFTSEGLPVGLMLTGRLGEESTLLRASAAFEMARPWAQRRPPGFD